MTYSLEKWVKAETIAVTTTLVQVLEVTSWLVANDATGQKYLLADYADPDMVVEPTVMDMRRSSSVLSAVWTQ